MTRLADVTRLAAMLTGPNEQAVQVMRQHADDFNRQMGNEVVGVDWRPPAGR